VDEGAEIAVTSTESTFPAAVEDGTAAVNTEPPLGVTKTDSKQQVGATRIPQQHSQQRIHPRADWGCEHNNLRGGRTVWWLTVLWSGNA
jgi:hypothetical protein